jgi:hypothetical protein
MDEREILDWVVTDAPDENDAADGPAPPPEEAPKAPARRPLPRRRLVWLLLAALAAGSALAYTRIGWLRLEAQIAAEVAYEDARSLEGNAALVRAVHARDDGAWLDLRADEAELGLPSTRPAAGLGPAAQPARLLSVTAAGRDIFVATVQRTWHDSAGHSYAFSTQQRYRNLGPGLWDRLPPADAGRSVTWSGLRLTADFPAADSAWMQAHLPRVDTALQAACASWSDPCPADLKAHFTFTVSLNDLPAPQPLASAGAQPGWPANGAYPVAFDVARALAPAAEGIVLPSPQLAGLPQDDTASQALVRSLVVHGLYYLAEGAVGLSQQRVDYIRDAMIAREEIRQGLSAAPDDELHPAHYVDLATLWVARSPDGPAPLRELSRRLQALSFMDFAVARVQVRSEGELLRSLRGRAPLVTWLERQAGLHPAPLLEAYRQQVEAGFERASTLAWQQLDGLLYQCNGQLWHVQSGQPRELNLRVSQDELFTLYFASISADGRLLAYPKWHDFGQSELLLVDLGSGDSQVIDSSLGFLPVGWAGSGELVYLRPAFDDEFSLETIQLAAYQPATGQRRVIYEGAIEPFPLRRAALSPDGWRLGLQLAGDRAATTSVIVSLDPADAADPVRVLGEYGSAPIFSPDGQTAVYAFNRPGLAAAASSSNPAAGLIGVEIASGEQRALLRSHKMPGSAFISEISALAWSPDGAWLAFMAGSTPPRQPQMGIYALPAAGGPVRVLVALGPGLRSALESPTFSADGAYVAYHELASGGPAEHAAVIEWASGAREHYEASYPGFAWSPAGHLLALANDHGLYVLEPSTGEFRWVSASACRTGVWGG